MDKRATKRKRVVLTVEDKLKVCRLAKQNVPKSVLMNQFKIGKSTLNDILRSEEKLTQFVLFSLGSFKCGVGGGRWAPYDRYFSYPAKIFEKGCPTWPDNRGCTAVTLV